MADQPDDFPDYITEAWIDRFVEEALKEDWGSGDHTTLATIPAQARRKARCLIKEEGVVAGLRLAQCIFERLSPDFEIQFFSTDGDVVYAGDEVFHVEGPAQKIVSAERLVLNAMQRMSGIATYTHMMKLLIQNDHTQLLDTRKTMPTMRPLEKWAVRIGGGRNHRMGLYDLIMIKDNHIDYAGSMEQAIYRAQDYLKTHDLDLDIEVETRDLKEVEKALAVGGVQTLLLDNMNPSQLRQALDLIDGQCKTEASGGINERTIGPVSQTGVDFISVGALTHSYRSMDISLKAMA